MSEQRKFSHRTFCTVAIPLVVIVVSDVNTNPFTATHVLLTCCSRATHVLFTCYSRATQVLLTRYSRVT